MNKKKPKFSIICLLRQNYKCYYSDLLNHLMNQSFSDFECIFIVNENGMDWVQIPDDRFRVSFIEIEEMAKRRNYGISLSKGDYVVFCDADDYFDENILLNFSKIADSSNPDLIIPLITREENYLGKVLDNAADIILPNRQSILDFFVKRYIQGVFFEGLNLDGSWCRAIKRKTLIDHGICFLEEPCRAEDSLFMNDLIIWCKKVVITPYYGYFWRPNNNSEMSKIFSFFYNVSPYFDKLYSQFLKAGYSISVYTNHCANILVSQIVLFSKARRKGIISYKDFKQKLLSFSPTDKNAKAALFRFNKLSIKKNVCLLLFRLKAFRFLQYVSR